MKQNQQEAWETVARKMGHKIPQRITRKPGITTIFPLIPLAYLNLAATSHAADWQVAKWVFAALAVTSIIGETIRQWREIPR